MMKMKVIMMVMMVMMILKRKRGASVKFKGDNARVVGPGLYESGDIN